MIPMTMEKTAVFAPVSRCFFDVLRQTRYVARAVAIGIRFFSGFVNSGDYVLMRAELMGSVCASLQLMGI